MDATVQNSLIVSVTAIAVALITSLVNLWQNRISLKYRLTEAAFNAKIQAYGDLATAMQAVDYAVKHIAFEVNNRARNFSMVNPDSQPGFPPGVAETLVPIDMYTQLTKAAQAYLDTYSRTRMYLTPDMDVIANEFAYGYITGVLLVPVPSEFTYEQASDWLRNSLPHSRLYVADLTAEMHKYIAAVEKGK